MKNNKTYIYGAVSLLLLVACMKDTLHDTPHPDRGAVALSVDWTLVEENADKPGTFTLHLRGAENITAEINTATPGALPLLLPGAYHALMYNTLEGFDITTDAASSSIAKSVSGNVFGSFIATVRKAADGNTLLPMPETLFAGGDNFSSLVDDTARLVIPVEQLTRRLLFRLTVTEGVPERISSVSGVFSGVAESVRLASGELSGEASVIPLFTRYGAEITASLNLLGITGTLQKLILTLHFTDGRSQTIESDLTELLGAFNENKRTSMEVSGSLQTPVATGFGTSAITDWQVQEETDIIIQ